MDITVNQVKLYVHEQGQGLPVILLHGFPFDHTIWDSMIAELEGHIRVIAPDLRGFGLSEAPEGVYAMRLQAGDVAALMDALGIAHAILVGHSMGGYIALAFAQAFPQKLLGLGLMATRADADSLERRRGRYETAEEVSRQGPKAVADSMAPLLTKNRALQEKLYEIMIRTHPNGLMGALKGMAERADMTGFLPRISVPALVLAGDADQLVPIDQSRAMDRAIPSAAWVEVTGTGHVPMLENPRACAQALDDLIAEVQGIAG